MACIETSISANASVSRVVPRIKDHHQPMGVYAGQDFGDHPLTVLATDRCRIFPVPW
jgi:hypothetical protein